MRAEQHVSAAEAEYRRFADRLGAPRDRAADDLYPEGDHTIVGPGGLSLPATESLRKMRRRARTEPSALDLVHSHGGWHVVSIKAGREEGGITSHRGALRGDEYVDDAAVLAAIEERLGFTQTEVLSVYRRGKLSASQGELRARIDARLLALSRAGAQVHLLGKRLGLVMSRSNGGGEFCQPVSRALARARALDPDPTTTEVSDAR